MTGMKNTPLSLFSFLLLAVSLVLVTGCSSGRTAAGTEYDMTAAREIRTSLGASLQAVHEAALETAQELGFEVTSQSRDAFVGRIEAETADEKTVSIETDRKADNVTEVRIKVGGFGDTDRALEVLNRIEAKL